MSYQTNTTPPTLLNKRRIRRGLTGFAALSVAGLGLLFAFTKKGDVAEVARNMSAGFMALAALGMMADTLIGAVRYQIFLRRIRPGSSLWLPIQADLANRFIGAVTPSQTGGGPAQVFVLWKGGIPVPAALSFLMINFVATLVFFLLAGSLTAWALRDYVSQGAVHFFVQWGFVAFVGGLTLMIVGLARPDVFVHLIRAMVRRLESRRAGWARAMVKVGRLLLDSAEDYRTRCTEFTREAPLLVGASFALTVLLYLNKFTLGWLIMRGLGVHGDYGLTLAVQALLQFILYVAPTPGGSGIAELSTGALMAVLLPSNLLAPFTLAYRFFLLYLPAAVGALVLARVLPKATRPSTRRARPAKVGAAVTVLALVIGASGTEPVAAQAIDFRGPVKMPVVSMLTNRRHEAEVERWKKLIREALDRGSVRPEKSAAEADFTRAVEDGRRLVQLAPDDADAHYLLAVSLGLRLETAGLREKIAMGNETRREAETALDLDPDHAGAHHVMGRLYAGAMRLSPVARFLARQLLGAEAMAGVSWKRAEYHFRRAQELEPDNPRHSMELGALYMDTDRPTMALEELTRAIQDPVKGISDSLAVAKARKLLARLPPSAKRD